MQISKIQNSQTQKMNFKSYSITPQAKRMINTPEKLQITKKAEKLFSNSKHIDFNIGDNFVPTVRIKETGEQLVGDIKASLIKCSNGLKISDEKTSIDIVIPRCYSAEILKEKINKGFDNIAAKASYIGEIIKITAEDHQGRFLL